MLQNLKLNLFAGAGLGVVPEKMTEEGKHISNPFLFPEHETADPNQESPAELEKLNQASGVRKVHYACNYVRKSSILLAETGVIENKFSSMWVQPY